MNILEEFQKRAAAAGLTEEQLTAFVNKNFGGVKTAAQQETDIYNEIITDAGVVKSAEATAYLDGFLKQALDRGFSPADAVHLSKVALANTFPAAPVEATKVAATEVNPEKTAYFEGIFEKAAAYGFSQEDTALFLNKMAAGAPGMGWVGSAGRSAGTGMELARSGGNALAHAGGEAGKGGGISKLLAGLGLGGAAAVGGAGIAGAMHKPGLMEQLQQMISQNPELAGGLGGAAVGGGVGALSGLPGEQDPNDPSSGQSHVGRNALLGALAGGGAGAGAGHMAPDLFKKM